MSDRKMEITDLHGDFQKKFARMPFLPLDRPFFLWLTRKMITLFFREKRDKNVELSKHRLSASHFRLYQPKTRSGDAAMVWIHGGGMVVGNGKSNDEECNHYAAKYGLTVVSAEYRLAPEHPYPAAIDDCFEAWEWLLDNAESLGVDPHRIAIAGQSAGGGLAAALCQRIQDAGGIQPAVQILFYPMLDDRTAARDELTPVAHIGWYNRNNKFGWSSYLGAAAGSEAGARPWASPGRRTELAGQPPAWIGVGDKDLFFDEDTAYAKRLRDGGVACELHVTEKAPHGFDIIVPESDLSISFRASADRFLEKHLDLDS